MNQRCITEQQTFNFNRIAAAIDYIQTHFKDQPDLDEVAEKIHLSPFHFQRIFTEWAGISPKKFLQFISLQHAKKILKENQSTIFDAAHETGLSGTSRLHDLFIKIEGMTPAEFKNSGKNLSINYNFYESPFGKIIVATTEKGICYMAFATEEKLAFQQLQAHFQNAIFTRNSDLLQQNAVFVFQNNWEGINEVKLHLKGTGFQLKVWEALLKIPMGGLATYSEIARRINKPNASRAVGTAIGNNPVAFLIPCHRVIKSTGIIGDYMWGSTRKKAIIGWEGARINYEEDSN